MKPSRFRFKTVVEVTELKSQKDAETLLSLVIASLTEMGYGPTTTGVAVVDYYKAKPKKKKKGRK